MVQAAEDAGFEYLLIPVGSVCWRHGYPAPSWEQLARDYGDLLMPHLWIGITKVRPGAGIAVVGNPEQCAATLQRFIDAGCHSFCLSVHLHDEEAERFGRLIRPIAAANNRGRLAA
ncbi:alkanesulfonate monooxygenase SsuD/methylene tetrahydromethanopterin reductase-like flavin-dependent oxidoreductase (luciferase family) [Bradyrhizobium sp. i1.8.4]|uniref:hypothetical protein n=1 Tax=unclassified Bradyrhizobium TaxID=2631580 RepID=UPI003D1E9046